MSNYLKVPSTQIQIVAALVLLSAGHFRLSGQTASFFSYTYAVNSFEVNGSFIVAATNNGIYCSEDNGGSWHASAMRNTYVQTVKMNSSVIMALCEFQKLWWSTDSGNTWTQLENPPKNDCSCLEVCGETFFAGTNWGMYRSGDNGNTWSYSGLNWEGSEEVAYIYGSGTTYMATCHSGHLRSIDSGYTWQQIPVSYSLLYADCFAAKDSVFIHKGYSRGGHCSTDAGATWSGAFEDCWDMGAVTISESSVLGGSGDSLLISFDYGKTYAVNDSTFRDNAVSALGTNGRVVFAGTCNGDVFRSADCGITWAFITNLESNASVSYHDRRKKQRCEQGLSYRLTASNMVIHPSVPCCRDVNLTVFSPAGRKLTVLSPLRSSSDGTFFRWNISEYANGSYVVRLKTQDGFSSDVVKVHH